jgi:hypothetical protein
MRECGRSSPGAPPSIRGLCGCFRPRPIGRVPRASRSAARQSRKFAEVGDILRLQLGTQSMRKSRGAALFAAGVPLEVITKTLNHSSPAVTLRYIGVDRARVNQTYDDFVL